MKAQEFAFFTCVFTKKLQEIKFEILYTQKRMCHKLMIHPLLVVGRDRICRWKRQDMSLEETGYVVETISISGRTTAVVHAVVNCYAPTIIQFIIF